MRKLNPTIQARARASAAIRELNSSLVMAQRAGMPEWFLRSLEEVLEKLRYVRSAMDPQDTATQ